MRGAEEPPAARALPGRCRGAGPRLRAPPRRGLAGPRRCRSPSSSARPAGRLASAQPPHSASAILSPPSWGGAAQARWAPPPGDAARRHLGASCGGAEGLRGGRLLPEGSFSKRGVNKSGGLAVPRVF